MVLGLLYIIHVLVSLFLVGVVLLQQGKGADLSVFGGGSTMTAFGARSATNILHRLTVVAFVAFMVTTLTIGVLQRGGSGTVMSTVAPPAAETSDDATAASADDSDAPVAQEASPPETEAPAVESATPGEEDGPADSDPAGGAENTDSSTDSNG